MDQDEFQRLLREEESRSGNPGVLIAMLIAALCGFVVGVLVGSN